MKCLGTKTKNEEDIGCKAYEACQAHKRCRGDVKIANPRRPTRQKQVLAMQIIEARSNCSDQLPTYQSQGQISLKDSSLLLEHLASYTIHQRG